MLTHCVKFILKFEIYFHLIYQKFYGPLPNLQQETSYHPFLVDGVDILHNIQLRYQCWGIDKGVKVRDILCEVGEVGGVGYSCFRV